MKNKITTLILVMMCSLASTAQVGIGTNSPNANAALDVVSTTQGILFPRMTAAQRDLISSPAEGLTIFNTDVNYIQTNISTTSTANWKNWSNGFEDNTTCTTKVISITSCASVTGATLNDIVGTADGTEYDWTNAASSMSGGTTQALVEIGGQCWFGRNTTAAPTAPCADAINTGCNVWAASASSPGDIGSWGYYNTSSNTAWATSENAAGEGLLYQWSAAMNGSTTERAQGVCPTDWHVPSDCEWMYLENTLGMSTADQQGTGLRNSGSVGSKLSNLTSSFTNSSGFTALLAGNRITNGTFGSRSSVGNWWSSSWASHTHAHWRDLLSSQAGVRRNSSFKAFGHSVRCLKD